MRDVSKFLLTALCIFYSCSVKDPRTIVVWHSLRPTDRIVLQKGLDNFAQKHPGWKFSELFYAPEEARTNFIISALGGSGPALFWGANDNIGPFVEMKVIMPLEELLTKSFLDSFVTDPLTANTWMDGHLYQIADRIGNHLHLVYNRALVQQPPSSMNELIEMGKDLTRDNDGDGKADTYALVWNYTEPYFAVPFIGGYGGWIIDEQNNPTLNSVAVVKAAQLIFDLANKHKIIPLECDYEIANALFKDGYAAMIINGSWSWGSYIDNGIEIGLARIPKIDETGLWPSPAVSPLGYSVNVNLRDQKLKMTVDLLRYLTSSPIELKYTQVSAAIPSRIDAYADPTVVDNPMVKASLEQLIVGRIMSPVTEMRWIWDAMRPAYQSIFTGHMPPERAAREMQSLAEKLIRENRE
jgi:arabinogalactan oligomer/maltooligosaccharide transport system permease protein